MTIDLPTFPSVLQQDELWVDGQRIEDMDWKHRSNLVSFLRRSASTLQAASYLAYLHSCPGYVEDPSDSVASVQAHIEASFWWESEDWLEATPLMQKLVSLERNWPWTQRVLLVMRNRAYEIITGYRKQTLRFR